VTENTAEPAEMRFDTLEAFQAYLAAVNEPTDAPGDTQLRMLRHAMQDTTPACRDDERFVADYLTTQHRFELGKICRACPLRAACRAYATRARPEAGFWAGEMYDSPTARN